MKTNRLFCLIELAAVAVLYFFENNSGTRAALAVSALVPLLSVLCAYLCSRKAVFSLDVPRHGEKGAPLVCHLCAPPLPLCEGRAELRLQNAFTREEARAAAVVGEAVSLSVSHCGLLTVTAENAEIRDLFGLCRFPVSSGAPQTVPVWPTVFPAQVTLDCAAPQTREDSRLSSVRRGGDFTETQAVRPYHPGDPVRQIHWKLSAKMGKTMLREAGAPLTGDVLLALAVFPDEAPDPDALEASLCGLLSASQSLLAQGVAHHVAFWRHAPLAVSSIEDWARAQRMLLSPPPAPDDMSPAFARIAVFSPCAAIDASDPFARVTLVLPEGAQALVGDIPVAFFGVRAPFLTL